MTPAPTFFSEMAKAALVLDHYERQARLSPALLCLVPFMVMAGSLYSTQLWSLVGLVGLISMVGVMYLLADAARRYGKRHEARLWEKWGGAPSTQILRHRDDNLDPVSKRCYHVFLGKKINARFPSIQNESADPTAADGIYAAGCLWLRESTRDTVRFSFLYKSNVNYGFRRNCFGLRWAGLIVCALVIAWVIFRHGNEHFMLRVGATPGFDSIFNAGEVASILASLFMAIVWMFIFSEASVRESGFHYAKQLITSCEALGARAAATNP